MQYYGPYIDLSGEMFYLPKEWRQSLSGHGKSKAAIRCWQESKINYSFDDEMNGTQLIRNLNWLGRTNDLLEMNVSDDEEDSDNDVKKKPNLYSSGKRTTSNTMDERELR